MLPVVRREEGKGVKELSASLWEIIPERALSSDHQRENASCGSDMIQNVVCFPFKTLRTLRKPRLFFVQFVILSMLVFSIQTHCKK